MKNFRTISALLLAFLVLISSTSFTVGVHFCMGEVQNFALFAKAEKCKRENSLPACPRHAKTPCCADETIVHEGDDFKASLAQISIDAPAPIEVQQPFILISEAIPSEQASQTAFFNYDPPLRSVDFTVELQVFII